MFDLLRKKFVWFNKPRSYQDNKRSTFLILMMSRINILKIERGREKRRPFFLNCMKFSALPIDSFDSSHLRIVEENVFQTIEEIPILHSGHTFVGVEKGTLPG